MKRLFAFLIGLSILFSAPAYAMQPFDVRSVYAAGTAYTVTNAQAALDFGTTDPSLTINSPGTWLIFARVNLKYTGATFAASRTCTINLYRTNNTAGNVTGAQAVFLTDIITTLTYTAGVVLLPPTLYTTSNNNDVLTLYAGLDTAPTAGSFDAVAADIIAIKLY